MLTQIYVHHLFISIFFWVFPLCGLGGEVIPFCQNYHLCILYLKHKTEAITNEQLFLCVPPPRTFVNKTAKMKIWLIACRNNRQYK